MKPKIEVAELPEGVQDGINYLNENTVLLSFYVPNKKFIYVIGDFNDWQKNPEFLMKKTPDSEYFWLIISNLEIGKEYAFQYLIDDKIAVGDPYCEKILDPKFDSQIPEENYPNLKPYPYKNPYGGIVSVLQTSQNPYQWKVLNFRRPQKENLVIYELLIRDFIRSRKYRDVADSIEYFKRLGINAIELLPIQEFTANESWGYNPTYYFAPDKAYGTKEDLEYLIDKCHENGIAVVLDVVFNHADYEFPYVKAYWNGRKPSSDNPFFNQKATHPYSVFFDFNHENECTQKYFDRVIEFWLKEYKIDGFRFDLSKGFTQKNTYPDVSLWSQYDASRIRLLKRFYEKIRSIDSDCYLILEHFADNSEETELANMGFMLWGNLNEQFRAVAKGEKASFEWLNYKNRDWNEPNLVGYMESHDEERLMYDTLRNGKTKAHYDTKNLETALERMKALAAVFFSYPGPKMLWQFVEFGYDVSINFNDRVGNKPLKWEYLNDENRLKLYKVYCELIKLKITYKLTDFEEVSNGFVKITTARSVTFSMKVIANLGTKTIETTTGFSASRWYDYFTGKEIDFMVSNQKMFLQAGEFHILTSKKLSTPEQGLVRWDDSFLKHP